MSKLSFIQLLTVQDISEKYVGWLNSEQINRYLESKYSLHTLASVTEFVEHAVKDEGTYLFGIFCSQTSAHIGNIKIGPIDERYQRGEIGLIVGEPSYWGKGIATEAISLVTDFAINKLNFHKLEAGCYVDNIGSFKAFLKAGFEIEGTLREHVKIDGEWLDCYRLGKILDNAKE